MKILCLLFHDRLCIFSHEQYLKVVHVLQVGKLRFYLGKVLKLKTEHITGTVTSTITRRNTYDHVGRVKNTFLSINNHPEVLIARNEYNELGQLVAKKQHAVSDYDIGQPGVTYIPSVINASQYNNERMMIARTSVTLLPGFRAVAGSTFTARIEKPWSSQDPALAGGAFAQTAA